MNTATIEQQTTCPAWCVESDCWGDHSSDIDYVAASSDPQLGWCGAPHPTLGIGISMATPRRASAWLHLSARNVDCTVDLTPAEARTLAANLNRTAGLIEGVSA